MRMESPVIHVPSSNTLSPRLTFDHWIASEPGWDGGPATGSVSPCNRAHVPVGVQPGDNIRLAYDFGMDGCTGRVGWFVDDIKLQTCSTKKS